MPPSSAPREADLGPNLPLGNVIVGLSGQVRFEDNSKAGLATFHNEGQTEYFNGAGGFTVFTDTSTAEDAEIHNHGATFANANMNGIGGATFFYDTSTAGAANITNHADGLNHHSSVCCPDRRSRMTRTPARRPSKTKAPRASRCVRA